MISFTTPFHKKSDMKRRKFIKNTAMASAAMAFSAQSYARIMGANDSYYGRDSVLAAEAKAVWYSTHFLSLCDFDQTAQPSQIRITGTAVSGGLHMDQIDVNADD